MMALIVLALALFFLGFPSVVSACSCANFGPVAELIRAAHCSSTAVFVGVVTEVHIPAPLVTLGNRRRTASDVVPSIDPDRVRVQLTVEEAWRGVKGSEAEVWTGDANMSCGYQFLPGERYLVYASGNPGGGKLVTSICSRTRLVSQATEDLSYIRAFPKNGPAGRIYGGVYHAYGTNVPPVPHPGVRVAAERSDGFVAEAVTDARGHFDISGLAPGTYSVDVIRPPTDKQQRQTVTLHDAAHCAQLSFDY